MFGTFEQALYDGEDFELLFTVRAEDAEAFDFQCLEALERKFPRIGKITAQPDVLTLGGAILDRKAFEHFRLERSQETAEHLLDGGHSGGADVRARSLRRHSAAPRRCGEAD
jgi:hypothetical protein